MKINSKFPLTETIQVVTNQGSLNFNNMKLLQTIRHNHN